MSAHHLYSFPAASPTGRTEVRQAIWKPVVLLSCQSQLPLQYTKSSSTSTLLHVFSQKKQRQSSNLAERHQRQVGLRQMPRIRTRDTFCFTWESYRPTSPPPPPPFPFHSSYINFLRANIAAQGCKKKSSIKRITNAMGRWMPSIFKARGSMH